MAFGRRSRLPCPRWPSRCPGGCCETGFTDQGSLASCLQPWKSFQSFALTYAIFAVTKRLSERVNRDRCLKAITKHRVQSKRLKLKLRRPR